MNKISIIILIVMLFHQSCNIKSSRENISKIDTSVIYQRSIPAEIIKENEDVKRHWFLNALGLPSIEKGYNGIQIRVFIEYLYDKGAIIVIKDTGNIQLAYIIKYNIMRDSFSTKVIKPMKKLLYKRYPLINPKSGWNYFFSYAKSNFHNILNQKYNDTIYHDTERELASVEYSESKFHNLFEFIDPNNNNSKASIDMYNFLSFIKKEFQLSL